MFGVCYNLINCPDCGHLLTGSFCPNCKNDGKPVKLEVDMSIVSTSSKSRPCEKCGTLTFNTLCYSCINKDLLLNNTHKLPERKTMKRVEITDKEGCNYDYKGDNLRLVNNAGVVEIYQGHNMIALFTAPTSAQIFDEEE